MLSKLVNIAIAVPITYGMIILFIRLSGKRSTSQMNNFDWIVTVTIGSVAASMILLDDVTLLEGGLAMALLLGLQYLVTSAVKASPLAERIVKARPATLMENGKWDEKAMRAERVTRSEVEAAVRQSGESDIDDVRKVVLETDASLSIIPRRGEAPARRVCERSDQEPDPRQQRQRAGNDHGGDEHQVDAPDRFDRMGA